MPDMRDGIAKALFEGHADRECGDHRTVGSHRAWCFDCSEWCYPAAPCKGCEVPALRAERDALKAALAEQTQRTLNAAADKLYALPATDGAALKGPYWYRQGFTQAADLLRDWADYPAALATTEETETPHTRLTEQQGGIPNDAITPDDPYKRGI